MTTALEQVAADVTAFQGGRNDINTANTVVSDSALTTAEKNTVHTALAKAAGVLESAEEVASAWVTTNTPPVPSPAPVPTPTPVPVPPAPVPIPAPSGLIIAGNSKVNVLQSIPANGYPSPPSGDSLTLVLGSTTLSSKVVSTYANGAQAWSDYESPWWAHSFGWSQWIPGVDGQLVSSIQLAPQTITTGNWYANGASGAYDTYWETLGKNLVAAGLGNSVLRLALENNLTGNNDSIPSTYTSAQLAQYVQCYENAITAIKSGAPNVLICWNPNAVVRAIPFAEYCPNNADIYGMDIYDAFADNGDSVPVGSNERFEALCAQPLSLNDFTTFANAAGKPMALPEWGISSDGDDPLYVEGIANWVKENNVAWQCWFNSGDGSVQLGASTIPNSTAAYIAAFG